MISFCRLHRSRATIHDFDWFSLPKASRYDVKQSELRIFVACQTAIWAILIISSTPAPGLQLRNFFRLTKIAADPI